MNKIDKNQIINDLISIGIKRGDLVFITANISKTGLATRKKQELYEWWVDILEQVVGKNGGVILASYSKTAFIFKKEKIIFTEKSETTSGLLSEIVLKSKNSIRSTHPTNSYVGIGERAKKILEAHNSKSGCYYVPIRVAVEGGKNLMLGTIDNVNAPMSLHAAQEILGITKTRHFLWLKKCYYKVDERIIKFTRTDSGGCSAGGAQLYGHFINDGCIKFGDIGLASSALIDGKKSLDLTLDLIKKNEYFLKCNNDYCMTCYGYFTNTPIKSIRLWCYYLIKLVKLVLR